MTINPNPSPAFLEKAKSIKLLILDVDGVLTEGGLHYSDQGEQTKTFNTLDGHGLKLLQAHGISVAIISGRDGLALRRRLSDLGISHVFAGVQDKKAAAQQLLTSMGLEWSQAAAMGDDWPDLAMLMPAGLSAAPPGAHTEVLTRVDWVTSRGAGHGAVRDVCDLLLRASGRYAFALQEALK
jgi:3-deoxy-D-manno-octulosonate 8-phosphate phosphatase (KDO 8-P phosphatase)